MLVIRNSQLEELHAHGPVNDGGLTAVTSYGLGPLSHLLAARWRRPLPSGPPDDRFAGLAEAYPRSWACLTALRTVLNSGGGEVSYRLPAAPLPVLPDATEVTQARAADHLEAPSDAFTGVVLSGIDPRFDPNAIQLMETAQSQAGLIVGLSSLSRISRNSRKLLRVLDFFLAHRGRILTTNYLLTSKYVWVRRRELVKPDSLRTMEGLRELSGLSGSHRKPPRHISIRLPRPRHDSPSRDSPPASQLPGSGRQNAKSHGSILPDDLSAAGVYLADQASAHPSCRHPRTSTGGRGTTDSGAGSRGSLVQAGLGAGHGAQLVIDHARQGVQGLIRASDAAAPQRSPGH